MYENICCFLAVCVSSHYHCSITRDVPPSPRSKETLEYVTNRFCKYILFTVPRGQFFFTQIFYFHSQMKLAICSPSKDLQRC